MMIKQIAAFKIAALLALFLTITMLGGCGTLKHSPAPRLDSNGAQNARIESILADIDAARAPEGVDAAIYEQLKAALRAAIIKQGDKLASRPPLSAQDLIPDFSSADNGDGTSTFTWSYYNTGDYNQDGRAGIADITPIAQHFGQLVAEHPEAEVVDGNGDGTVNIPDITPLAMNFDSNIAEYLLEGTDSPGGSWSTVGNVPISTAIDGSRNTFLATLDHAAFIYFRITPLDSDGNPGLTSMENQVISVKLDISSETAGPGEPVDVQASTLDRNGNLMHSDFIEVFYTVSPTRSDTMSQTPADTQARVVELHDNADGTFTKTFYSDVAGDFAFSLIVVDTRLEDKISLSDSRMLQVVPGAVAGVAIDWGLTGRASTGPVYFYALDAYSNIVPNPNPADFVMNSDNADIVPSDPMLYPGDPTLMYVTVEASSWSTAILELEHIPTGAGADKVTWSYTPWRNWVRPWEDPLMPELPGPLEKHVYGMMADSAALSEQFEVVGDIRVPAALGDGWQSFSLQMAFPDTGEITLDDVVSQLPNVDVTYSVSSGGGWNYVDISGNTTDNSEYTGEQAVYAMRFTSAAVPTHTYLSVGLVGATMLLKNDVETTILAEDGIAFPGYYDIELVLKPVKKLKMHIYRVEGAATDEEINADVKKAQDTFNLNALLCTMEFFVEFTPAITTIPLADWGKIDVDNDGLDRYDSNGDGDYTDAGDNNDLANAMGLDYYDVSAATENIYYVPDIRGGAMGTTYWPNGQVAVKDSVAGDGLTLAHEKVHEMDWRKDGDFDVKDGADMDASKGGIQRDLTAESQGAYNEGNLMNYAKTGQIIGHEQGRELDP